MSRVDTYNALARHVRALQSETVTTMLSPRSLLSVLSRRAVVLLALALAACGGGAGSDGSPNPEPPAILLNPSAFNETAPATYVARFNTSQGLVRIEVTRAWAPLGADRFYNLVKNGYYSEVRFFRVLTGFVAQFGIHGSPEVNAVWRNQRINDDPVTQSNLRGTLTFATGGANTRTTQLFFNLVDNTNLDTRGFAPIGRVITGMDLVDKFYADYGEGAPNGNGPSQSRIQSEGNAYLKADFPRLDFILDAAIETTP